MRYSYIHFDKFQEYYKQATRGKNDKYLIDFWSALCNNGINAYTNAQYAKRHFESNQQTIKVRMMTYGIPEGVCRSLITHFKKWMEACC